MKTMTCQQLGGVCTTEFHAETFEEMAALSKEHGMEKFKQSEPEHIKVMQEMGEMMQNPQVMQEWMDKKRNEFDQLPNDR